MAYPDKYRETMYSEVEPNSVEDGDIAGGAVDMGSGTDGSTAGNLKAQYQVVNNIAGGGSSAVATTVAHTLGRVPVGYIVTNLKSTAAASGACAVLTAAAASAWTSANIYIKSESAGTSATILIF